MPKEMINVTIQRKQGEPWGMVIVGGKDQSLTVKLGRIKVNFSTNRQSIKFKIDLLGNKVIFVVTFVCLKPRSL